MSLSQGPSAWPSALSGYLDRAAPYPDSASFKPPRSSLELIVLRNAQAEPKGLTLALFSSDGTTTSNTPYAVDAVGSVYVLQEQDAKGILSLAKEVSQLQTGEWGNRWTLKSRVSCRPVERIFTPKPSGLKETPGGEVEEEFVEISVYGFNNREKELQETTSGRDTLPDSLGELTGLVLQGRESREGSVRNDEVLSLVKAMI
ncbi:hypothetical protein BKA70DRAFT_1308890 [Coprinopsis sp. MPI-PUGE-AT-0042]|nr:hypothetical protein BKA70DRAFT_1308890 [Coprinopsis sp. MPI-PUGE-AT-0042]